MISTQSVNWKLGIDLLPSVAPDFHLPSYLAGIIDGDGYVGISRSTPARSRAHTPSYRELLTVEMCDELPIKILSSLFGAPYHLKQYAANKRPIYTWRPARLTVNRALLALSPYLIVKRAQAETALQFRKDVSMEWKNEPKNGSGRWKPFLSEQHLTLREHLYERIKSLNNECSSSINHVMAGDFHPLSYMGGMFDSEGCVTISKAIIENKRGYSTRYAAVATVEMIDGRPPNMFKNLFGGVVQDVARFRGFPKCGLFTVKWKTSCKSAAKFVNTICHYLIVKRERAEIVLDFQRNLIRGKSVDEVELTRRETCRQRIMQLNKPFKRDTVSVSPE